MPLRVHLFNRQYHCIDPVTLEAVPPNNPVYGLREDLVARGLLEKHADAVDVIGFHKFVELTVQHDKTVSWF